MAGLRAGNDIIKALRQAVRGLENVTAVITRCADSPCAELQAYTHTHTHTHRERERDTHSHTHTDSGTSWKKTPVV